MKEFSYLSSVLGIRQALFYFFYKINLKLFYSKHYHKKNINRKKRVEQVYEALTYRELNRKNIANKIYYQFNLINSKSNVWVRPFSSDLKVYHQIFKEDSYKCVIDIYNQLFQKAPSIVIDCGANIGFASIYFHSHYPDAKYILIEPFHDNIESIKLNTNDSGLLNCKIIEGAIWNTDTQLSLSRDFRDGEEWSIKAIPAQPESQSINGICLKTLVHQQKKIIDILKIDIEGSEVQLFEDKDYAGEFLRQVKCLVIEIHDEFKIREKIYQILIENKFFFYENNELTIALNKSFININN